MSDEEGILMPGSFIGLLGGGQLARMLILAGHPLGFRFVVLDPDSEAPASQVGARHL
ncbi:MAG TPA: 5-(carboxyamino)imidazole ribonucleotide synthase, partial [Deltaproteobacteria bacterium]|nr:5-(carboxyamino)imidazole ribonucleotide synthase [Deltaproteobacteria bacterium]